MKQLPVFEGWTVDVRLRQFRRGEYPRAFEFVSFDSAPGKELLSRWIDSGRAPSELTSPRSSAAK